MILKKIQTYACHSVLGAVRPLGNVNDLMDASAVPMD